MAQIISESQSIPGLARFDFESFRHQEIVFATLNLFVLGALLLLHGLFAILLGEPTPTLLITLGTAFLLRMLELLWLWAGVRSLSESRADALVWSSLSLNIGLAILLAFLTDRGDSPYFVLLALPVLQAAYRFRLPTLVGVIIVSDSITFYWVWHFAKLHPATYAVEYLEAGVISLVYALMGLLVWLLVNQLRRDQMRLAHNFDELERTRERLAAEEKLAAVGRLSSAVAHEIRNPVAIIASSLVTANRLEAGEQQRNEMYSIARSEAARLEKLTNDFLSYARPNRPIRSRFSLSEVLGYIAEVARVLGLKKEISIVVDSENDQWANLDRGQIQSALLNLVLNALDATPTGGRILVRCRRLSANSMEVQVENTAEPISDEVLSRMFEPFYTTKPNGTGLGLAISRNIARAHGGDLVVARNELGHVCFAMTLSDDNPVDSGANNHG